jgi:hypothetical protein
MSCYSLFEPGSLCLPITDHRKGGPQVALRMGPKESVVALTEHRKRGAKSFH